MSADGQGDLPPYAGMIVPGPDPVRLSSVKVTGVAASTGRPGEMIDVATRYWATSETHAFHRIATSMVELLGQSAAGDGKPVNLMAAGMLLALIRPDETADLYLDTAPVVMTVRPKKDIEAGMPMFSGDFSDILTMQFPTVTIAEDDQVIVIFREGFRHGIFFDLSREFDLRVMHDALGRLMRQLRYHEAYAVQSDPALLDTVIDTGWFPFIEINNAEFTNIFTALGQPDEFRRVELATVDAFPAARVTTMLERWLRHPYFKSREDLLRAGIDAFNAGNPIAAIKTLITEIEGILQDAHIAAVGDSAKQGKLIEFLTAEAIARIGADDTLVLPPEFQRYLAKNIFANFDPMAAAEGAARHNVSHGAAPSSAYTMVRALQVLLTLDQISFILPETKLAAIRPDAP